MKTTSRLILGIASSLLACAGCTSPRIDGWASRDEQKISFDTGLSWWNRAKRTLTIAFLPYEPDAGERAKIFQHRSAFLGMEKDRPHVELNLVFKPGATHAERATLERYYIVFGSYVRGKYGPMPVTLNRQHNDWTVDGGIPELAGELKEGGRVRGHFKRAWTVLKLRQGEVAPRETEPRYEWDLRFETALNSSRG